MFAPTLRRDKPWLATYLQGRRRTRLAAAVPSGALGLDDGLLQFYVPQEGDTYVRSFNETEQPPRDPFDGIMSVAPEEGSGNYPPGTALRYYVSPYRIVDGRIVHCGLFRAFEMSCSGEEDSGVVWEEWGNAAPAWVTGFCIVRWVNTTELSFVRTPSATMSAGWVDQGTGWTAGLPEDLEHPTVTAKVLWCLQNYLSGVQDMPTVASPLGGVAFDSRAYDVLFRGPSVDLRLLDEGTMAAWVCPQDATGGVLWSLRGVAIAFFGGDYSCDTEGNGFAIGDIAVADHQDGDWYLMVMRNDALTATLTIDLIRQRDGARFQAVAESAFGPLTAEDDFFFEGLHAALAFGSSWHWNVQGFAYYDRMGVWDRPLSDDNVTDLFNLGLGWMPGS